MEKNHKLTQNLWKQIYLNKLQKDEEVLIYQELFTRLSNLLHQTFHRFSVPARMNCGHNCTVEMRMRLHRNCFFSMILEKNHPKLLKC